MSVTLHPSQDATTYTTEERRNIILHYFYKRDSSYRRGTFLLIARVYANVFGLMAYLKLRFKKHRWRTLYRFHR